MSDFTHPSPNYLSFDDAYAMVVDAADEHGHGYDLRQIKEILREITIQFSSSIDVAGDVDYWKKFDDERLVMMCINNWASVRLIFALMGKQT